MNKTNNVLVCCLSVFQLTGGIEKFNRSLIKAIPKIPNLAVNCASMIDETSDERYVASTGFIAGKSSKRAFISAALVRSLRMDVMVLTHINLAVLGVIYKIVFPWRKLIVVTHGIEVWRPLSWLHKLCLRMADKVCAVSIFTANQMILRHKLSSEKISILHNTIDPCFPIPDVPARPVYLMERYRISERQKVILTLARLSSDEQYKGYDMVLRALPELIAKSQDFKYVIAGRYDDAELTRLQSIVKSLDLTNHVVIAGFIPESELSDHYQLADLFVMPSTQEGFGIVYLESMACGTPVLAGDRDGAAEALQYGLLGQMVNPADQNEIAQAMHESLVRHNVDRKQLQVAVLKAFSFTSFCKKVEKIFNT